MSRAAEITEFLDASGWGTAARAPLAGDASARRYERLTGGPRPAILMDTPPESGLEAGPFLNVAGWLRRHGLSAPEILAAAPERGLALLEDFGDDLFATLCAQDPARETPLYDAAIETLARMQELSWDDVPGWTPPPYDMATLMREARLMVEWYLPAATGAAVPADLAEEYDALCAEAFAPLLPGSTVPIYRDYHAENLIWLPERAGVARVGLLDFQDMLIGHPAYDFVSLTRDARRDVAPARAAHLRALYLARSGRAAGEFDHAAHVLSAQRNLKILGLFTRLRRRDGKARYLDYLPRVWGHLQGDLGHPALAPLRAFLARHAPAPDAAARARIAMVPA